MRVELLDYELPDELVALRPAERRDEARLLVVERRRLAHHRVRDLPELVEPGTLIVVNDTKVIPARLFGRREPTGGRVELLLVERVGPAAPPGGRERWRAMGRASKPLRAGTEIVIDPERLHAAILGPAGSGPVLEVELEPRGGLSVEQAVEAVGHVPLPPYVRRADDADDRTRYQTIFARVPGSVAAPTAGLHLTDELFERLSARSCEIAKVTLHVGLGTFQPVTVADLDDHPMHEERFVLPPETAAAVERARERRAPVMAVGTTVVRTLESAADPDRPGYVREASGTTRLLIQPGYTFRVVDRLMTNFHLPRSTLLALVAAFAGRERILSAYRAAVEARYRFFSYGDAMLLDRSQEAA